MRRKGKTVVLVELVRSAADSNLPWEKSRMPSPACGLSHAQSSDANNTDVCASVAGAGSLPALGGTGVERGWPTPARAADPGLLTPARAGGAARLLVQVPLDLHVPRL